MKKIFISPFIILFSLTVIISCSSETEENTNGIPNVPVDILEIYIDENPITNSEIVIIEGASTTENISFTLSNEEPLNSLKIDESTGQLTVKDSLKFNFETNPIITATANVFKQYINNNGQSTIDLIRKTNIQIHLNDVYEKYSHIGDITLYNQEDVNHFGLENPWGVSGTLSLRGNDIVDLSPISGILNVGTLELKNFEQPFPNMSFIDEVKNSLIIENNPGITNFFGIPSIENLEADFKIINNNQIVSLEGIPYQITIEGGLYIKNNSLLNSLEGLQNINTVNGYIFIWNNVNLEDITAFSGLTILNSSLTLDSNYSLTNLNGLENITEINGRLKITGQNLIFDLNPLNNLQKITGTLQISGNPLLYNIDALSNLQILNGDFRIVGNQVLNDFCGVSNLFTNGVFNGEYIVFSNLYNPTQQDILDGNCSN